MASHQHKTKYTITLKDGKSSNYHFHIKVTADQKKHMYHHVLQDYQKDMKAPGFRKGHMPLEMIEKQVNQNTLLIGVIEHMINEMLTQIIEENNEKKWIGQVYDLDTQSFGDLDKDGEIAFSLDVFPEVVEKDKKRKDQAIEKYDTKVTEEDINTSIDQLRSSYANFDDVKVVSDVSLMRLKITFLDKDGKEVGKGKNQYLGSEELSEYPELHKKFLSKKKGDILELDYKQASKISLLQYKGEEEVVSLRCEILDIKEKTLPELNQAFIDKVFNREEESISSVEELQEQVKKTLKKNKEENGLFEQIDTYLVSIDGSFDVEVPKTLVDEEVNNRLQQLAQQLGGEEGLKAHFSRMGEEESQKYLATIRDSATKSIHKYFVMKYVAQELELDIDWDKNQQSGTIEQKLYDKLVK